MTLGLSLPPSLATSLELCVSHFRPPISSLETTSIFTSRRLSFKDSKQVKSWISLSAPQTRVLPKYRRLKFIESIARDHNIVRVSFHISSFCRVLYDYDCFSHWLICPSIQLVKPTRTSGYDAVCLFKQHRSQFHSTWVASRYHLCSVVLLILRDRDISFYFAMNCLLKLWSFPVVRNYVHDISKMEGVYKAWATNSYSATSPSNHIRPSNLLFIMSVLEIPNRKLNTGASVPGVGIGCASNERTPEAFRATKPWILNAIQVCTYIMLWRRVLTFNI